MYHPGSVEAILYTPLKNAVHYQRLVKEVGFVLIFKNQ